jgi:hypothetical protein
MKRTTKPRPLELLDVLGVLRGRTDTNHASVRPRMARAGRAAVMAAEAAALLSVARRLRRRRDGVHLLPIVAAVVLARHLQSRPQLSDH